MANWTNNRLPDVAVQILGEIIPAEGHVTWRILHSPNEIHATFTWTNKQILTTSHLLEKPQTHKRKRRRNSPSQTRRNRKRLEAFLARKKGITHPYVATDIDDLDLPEASIDSVISPKLGEVIPTISEDPAVNTDTLNSSDSVVLDLCEPVVLVPCDSPSILVQPQ
jgi:hypothetical protein